MILLLFYTLYIKQLHRFYNFIFRQKLSSARQTGLKIEKFPQKIIFYRIVNPTKSGIIFLIYCNMLHMIFLYCQIFTKPDSDFKVSPYFLGIFC